MFALPPPLRVKTLGTPLLVAGGGRTIFGRALGKGQNFSNSFLCSYVTRLRSRSMIFVHQTYENEAIGTKVKQTVKSIHWRSLPSLPACSFLASPSPGAVAKKRGARVFSWLVISNYSWFVIWRNTIPWIVINTRFRNETPPPPPLAHLEECKLETT